MSNGIVVLGRDDRMGLGTMTYDFCIGMDPDRLVIVEVGSRKGKLPDSHRWTPFRVNRNRLDESTIRQLLQGCKVVVGFETWYNPQLPVIARSMGLKSVLYPMWEWSSPQDCANSDYLLCLSETDYRFYWRHQSMPQRGVIKLDWPACPEVHDPDRKLNWPPKTFVHIAGNAAHNRDGTREVLMAAERLTGTRAALRVFANFDPWKTFGLAGGRPLWVVFMGSATSRKDLLEGCDCLVQPRRLGGHSLPINEAVGEGIPVITLDLPDWRSNPLKVPAHPQPPERFGPNPCPVWNADPEELGSLMRNLAVGATYHRIAPPSLPTLPTWQQFKGWWEKEIL